MTRRRTPDGTLPPWAQGRGHRHGSAALVALPWPVRHAVGRVEPAIDAVLSGHATSYWGRPLAGRLIEADDGHPVHRLRWTIDGEPVAELRVGRSGPSTLVVHDFSVLAPLRAAVRTRHVRVRAATYRDRVDGE